MKYQRARKASARGMKSCQENKILTDSSTRVTGRLWIMRLLWQGFSLNPAVETLEAEFDS
jgi:hypothetical protein